MHRVIIALPCYNEGANLPALLDQFVSLHKLMKSSYRIEVLVIDDCSKDNTTSVVTPYLEHDFISYHKHEVNKGLTGGINTSFERFFEEITKDQNIIACGLMDGDNSHNPMTIMDMVPRILQGNDVVVASRYRTGSKIVGVTSIRQILSL